MTQKIVKTTKKVLIASVLVIIIMFIMPISYNVDISRAALVVNGSNNTTRPVVIRIIGRYTWRFIRPHGFVGRISIDGYSLTERSNYTVDIEVGRERHEWLQYRRTGTTHFTILTFGKIYTSQNFREILIVPFNEFIENPAHVNGGGNLAMGGENMTVIAYPATERSQAIRMANRRLSVSYPGFLME